MEEMQRLSLPPSPEAEQGQVVRGCRDAIVSLRGNVATAAPCCAPTCQHPCRDVGSTHPGPGQHSQGQAAFRFIQTAMNDAVPQISIVQVQSTETLP